MNLIVGLGVQGDDEAVYSDTIAVCEDFDTMNGVALVNMKDVLTCYYSVLNNLPDNYDENDLVMTFHTE